MGTSEISVIPRPVRIEVHHGTFTLEGSARIEAPAALAKEAEYLAARLRRCTGYPLEISTSDAKPKGRIALALNPGLSQVGQEGYRLKVGAEAVELEAVSCVGIFYGIQTLLQLLPPAVFRNRPHPGAAWTMPQVEIEDFPRFIWRGAMLDSCRHFQPVEFIRKFIDALALHKFNTFHWHLTDDQGWRFESKKYPKLTEIAAWREGTWLGNSEQDLRHDNIRHGGFYTQEQLRDLVRYAADRHITIVPEIEMPGHAQAAVTAYPEFGCTGRAPGVRTRWGISEDIYCPSEKTVRFLQDILLEVMEIFPSRFIHIGGDEAHKAQWEQSAGIKELAAAAGAKNMDEMQSHFIRRMDQFLARQRRRLVGWDEILEGGLAEGATVMSWRGVEGGIAAAKMGHDVVMTPCTHVYFDHYQSKATDHEPPAIGGFTPLEKTYSYEPVAEEIPADKAHHVLGVQGNIWTEYMTKTAQVEYMAFPRASALAEIAWSPRPSHDYPLFLQRLRTHLRRLDMLNVRYRPLDP